MPVRDAATPRATWQNGEAAVLELSGEWLRDGPPPEMVGEPPKSPPARYDTSSLGIFDSTLPAYLLAHIRDCQRDGESEDAPLDGLPDKLRGLMELALAVPEETEARGAQAESSRMKRLGKVTMNTWKSLLDVVAFSGEAVISVGRFLRGRARFRSRDFWTVVQECGADALPIVSLISFLIGLILAFVGNVQLSNFGANLYVADLVGLAMVREMGAVMTAIILSGRTGAAFAAHIGSMKANEEIDALRTFGFNPFDFLVLPRILALVLMLPLLTIYANLIGILGGMVVGALVGIPPVLYWNETLTVVNLTTASLGVFKSFFFGAAIAIYGCMQGMEAQSSSAGVGLATTRAVVASITAIIVIDSIFAVIFTFLGI